jgi:hypothetical protein
MISLRDCMKCVADSKCRAGEFAGLGDYFPTLSGIGGSKAR